MNDGREASRLASMWEATANEIPGGRRYRTLEDDSELSFRQVFELLRSSEKFADWYSDALARYEVEAFYWELPPLTTSTIDATLVVPCPRGAPNAFPQLAAFLRKGRKGQVRALWRVTAETMLDRISDTPIWLSTAGLGVIWLHLRLDSRPKYYSYRPYAER